MRMRGHHLTCEVCRASRYSLLDDGAGPDPDKRPGLSDGDGPLAPSQAPCWRCGHDTLIALAGRQNARACGRCGHISVALRTAHRVVQARAAMRPAVYIVKRAVYNARTERRTGDGI